MVLTIVPSVASVIYSETSLNWPALGPIKIAGFVRLPKLQRNVRQGLKKIGQYSGRASFLRGWF
jgi:hypothetical protein